MTSTLPHPLLLPVPTCPTAIPNTHTCAHLSPTHAPTPAPVCSQVFHTQELCNLLWAMAVCRHRPPARWLVAALGLLAERAEGLEPQVRRQVVSGGRAGGDCRYQPKLNGTQCNGGAGRRSGGRAARWVGGSAVGAGRQAGGTGSCSRWVPRSCWWVRHGTKSTGPCQLARAHVRHLFATVCPVKCVCVRFAACPACPFCCAAGRVQRVLVAGGAARAAGCAAAAAAGGAGSGGAAPHEAAGVCVRRERKEKREARG